MENSVQDINGGNSASIATEQQEFPENLNKRFCEIRKVFAKVSGVSKWREFFRC